jgi:hypothetical protein
VLSYSDHLPGDTRAVRPISPKCPPGPGISRHLPECRLRRGMSPLYAPVRTRLVDKLLIIKDRCKIRRQDGTDCVGPTVTAWPRRVERPPAPVSPSRFSRIAQERPILNLVVRDRDPAALDKHPNAVGSYAIRCGHAVPLRAAARATLVHEMTVDVMSHEWSGPKSNNEGEPKIASREHGPAPMIKCRPGRSEKYARPGYGPQSGATNKLLTTQTAGKRLHRGQIARQTAPAGLTVAARQQRALRGRPSCPSQTDCSGHKVRTYASDTRQEVHVPKAQFAKANEGSNPARSAKAHAEFAGTGRGGASATSAVLLLVLVWVSNFRVAKWLRPTCTSRPCFSRLALVLAQYARGSFHPTSISAHRGVGSPLARCLQDETLRVEKTLCGMVPTLPLCPGGCSDVCRRRSQLPAI